MDDYLCGVLTAEMGNLAPIEALKAQAVASRTYVMERMADKGLANQNHVPSDSRGQVFTMGEENSLCHQAVKATEGEILIFNKKPAKTLYSSCCGGVTADASHVFGGEKLAWLISQRDHGWLHKKSSNTSETLTLAAKAWCQQAPRFRWRREYTGEQISELLGLSQPVDSITVNQTTQSGRIEEIVVTEGKSTIKKMTGNQFRLKLQLPSTLFTVKHPAKSMLFTFIGGGFGHGVGLCQHGAMGQAREGKKYKEILTFYYPGTEIIRTY
jgi:stage II sporulation protein D